MPGTVGLAAQAAILAALVAVPLAVFGPAGGDAPAHLYRTELVRDGHLVWDGLWFAGHYPLTSYSLLYYFPAALVGNEPLTVAAVVLSAALFALVAEREWGRAAHAGVLAFAVVASGSLFTGTYPYAVGLAALLATLVALQRGRPWLAGLAVAATMGASPLAFLFLVVALCAVALVRRRLDRATAIVAGAVALAGAVQSLALALFPHDATYPFFRPWELLAVIAAGVLLAPLALRSTRGRTLAAFLALWTLAALLAFALATPVGENVTRLRGVILPLAVVAAGLARFRPVWLAVPALVGAVAWTLVPYVGAAPYRTDGRPATEAFWAPALAFLDEHADPNHRVEVVPTGDHWEAYWLPHSGFALARGWYRQLDAAENPLFYEQPLVATRYRAWLRRLGVRYVLLPDTQLGRAGEEREAELLRSGRSGLRLVAAPDGWRIYELPRPAPILARGSLTRYGHESVAGVLAARGEHRLAVRFTPYWQVAAGDVCVRRAPDGMTTLVAERRGRFELEIALLARGSADCD
jgi:hypothetical protein